MATRPFFKRKQYIIKRGLQFRFVGIVFALALLASAVTGYTVFATGWTLLGEKLTNVYPQGRLVAIFRTTNMALARNLFFASPFIFLLGFLFSHRIAGPVYRIEKTIYEIARGNLRLRIRLRKGDELRDLADIINDMTQNLDSSIGSNKVLLLKIQKDLDQVKNIVSSQPQLLEAIGPSIDGLETRIKDISSSLGKWATS